MSSPQRKVGAAGLGGALATLIVYGVSIAGLDVPPEAAAALATLLSFGAGYIVHE